MNISEKSAYLKGLIDGGDIKLGEKEKKIVDTLVELVCEMAEKICEVDYDLSDLYDGFDEVCDELDAINEDIEMLYDDGECGCGCGHHHGDEDEVLYDVECEKCHETICIDEDTLLSGAIECPSCGESLEFEIDCDCEECKGKEK